MNRTITTLTVGIVAAAALVSGGLLHSKSKHDEAVRRISSVFDAQPPFGIDGATLTHGPITVSSAGAVVPDLKLTLNTRTVIASRSVAIDRDFRVVAADLTVSGRNQGPGPVQTITANAFTALADPSTNELHGVQIKDIAIADTRQNSSLSVGSLAFDVLSPHLMKNMTASTVHFENVNHNALDIQTVTLDGLAAGTGEFTLGARRLVVSGLSSPTTLAQGAAIDSVVLEAAPGVGNVTSIDFSINGVVPPVGVWGGNQASTKGQIKANVTRTETGLKIAIAVTGTLLPDVTGEAILTGKVPASLVMSSPRLTNPPPAFTSAVVDVQDKTGGFKHFLDAGIAAQTPKGVDPLTMLTLATSMAHLEPHSLDPIADWITDPTRKMELRFLPSPVPAGTPSVHVTVEPVAAK